MIKMLPEHLKPLPEDPPPLEWSTYANGLIEQWRALLDSSPTESQVQDFLERYPCLLPRPYRLLMAGHHGPFPAAVVSQPVLPSYESRRPDFLWLTSDSMNYWAMPIEIESPKKKWFTKQGTPTAHLTQAMDQLRDWKRWFQEPHNVQAFLEYYGVPRSPHQVFACHYVLIYGRRDEAIHGPGRKKRPFMQQPDESIMSFDRLEPDRELADIITVRREGEIFRALYAQPTMELNRFIVSDWNSVRGVEEAIQTNMEMNSARKEHLLKMLAKWHEQLEGERAERRLSQR